MDAARRSAGPAKIISIRYCSSCPSLAVRTTRPHVPLRHHSPPRTRPLTLCTPYTMLSLPPCSQMLASRTFSSSVNCTAKRSYTCKCGCPLPCGPFGCGCGCLPPPCNQPPKCVQFMTGYYYYPYGWWFCGPYHVSGTCCPVAGSSACDSGCPGPKGCPPCCVCPATFAAGVVSGTPGAPGLKDMPKRSIITSKLPQPRLPAPPEPVKVNSRSGISKFFPFTATTAVPPTITPVAIEKRHYSTNNDNTGQFPNGYHLGSPGHAFSSTLPQNQCPPLKNPRALLTREERDMPTVRPGAFSYSSIPNYKSPYPQPFAEFRSYES